MSEGSLRMPKRKALSSRNSGSPGTPRRKSARLSTVVDQLKENERARDSFPLSPLQKTVLNDETDIELPKRTSWWKKVDNSRDVLEVLDNHKAQELRDVLDDVDVEILSQERKEYAQGLPESSDSESISSIVLPQRKLFTHKENPSVAPPSRKMREVLVQKDIRNKVDHSLDLDENSASKSIHSIILPERRLFAQKENKAKKKKFDHVIGKRESSSRQSNKASASSKNVSTKDSNVVKDDIPLLITSPDKTVSNKTKDLTIPGPPRNLFGNRAPNNKLKNMFAAFVVSESEDEISEIQPTLFAFQKNRNPVRHSTKGRDTSPTSTITTDMEMDDWKMLPSSTMVDHQLEAMFRGSSPTEKSRLSKLSEVKESATTNNESTNKTKRSNKSVTSENQEIDHVDANIGDQENDNIKEDAIIEDNKTYNEEEINNEVEDIANDSQEDKQDAERSNESVCENDELLYQDSHDEEGEETDGVNNTQSYGDAAHVTGNVTHDSTGRNRNKNALYAEVPLNNTPNHVNSFVAQEIVEHQLEAMSSTKKSRLGKLSEAKESATTHSESISNKTKLSNKSVTSEKQEEDNENTIIDNQENDNDDEDEIIKENKTDNEEEEIDNMDGDMAIDNQGDEQEAEKSHKAVSESKENDELLDQENHCEEENHNKDVVETDKIENVQSEVAHIKSNVTQDNMGRNHSKNILSPEVPLKNKTNHVNSFVVQEMVEYQLEAMSPSKKSRLSKLSEGKKLITTHSESTSNKTKLSYKSLAEKQDEDNEDVIIDNQENNNDDAVIKEKKTDNEEEEIDNEDEDIANDSQLSHENDQEAERSHKVVNESEPLDQNNHDEEVEERNEIENNKSDDEAAHVPGNITQDTTGRNRNKDVLSSQVPLHNTTDYINSSTKKLRVSKLSEAKESASTHSESISNKTKLSNRSVTSVKQEDNEDAIIEEHDTDNEEEIDNEVEVDNDEEEIDNGVEVDNEVEFDDDEEDIDNEVKVDNDEEELDNEVEVDNDEEELDNEVEVDNEKEEVDNDEEELDNEVEVDNEEEEVDNDEEELDNEVEVDNDEEEIHNEVEVDNDEEKVDNDEEEVDNDEEEIDNEVEDDNDEEEVDNEEEEINNEVEVDNDEEELEKEVEVDNDEEEVDNDEEEVDNDEEEVDNEEEEIENEDENIANDSQISQEDEQESERRQKAESDSEENHELLDQENHDEEVLETDEVDNTQSDAEVTHAQSNITHDTTGRYRDKNVPSPEVPLNSTTNNINSFVVQGRNTSIRKTIPKNFSIRPSMAPPRDSTDFSDGTKNSSAEGSGWDSHRTTRKTLRQTFGKDFTPRKSLRALVMEKSAKRQTMINEANAELRHPQANSTELPSAMALDDDMDYEDDSDIVSNHELSKRMRQTKLEMCLQKIQKENQERKARIEQQVKASLKVNPQNTEYLNRPAYKPVVRRPMKTIQIAPKKRTKPSLIPLEDLPPELLEDMKYKPPKRFKPSNAPWITKRLYTFLESKLEPKYDYKSRVRAESLVETLYTFVREIRKQRVAPPPDVATVKRELARLGIVKTHFDFYDFIRDFIPKEVKIKIVPDIVNDIPLPRNGVFADILAEE